MTLLRFWPAAVAALAVGFFFAWLHQRDARIAIEAVAAERLEDFRESEAARQADSVRHAQREVDFRADSARLVRLETEADSLRRLAERAVRDASQRAVEAGEDLRATLDSIGRVEDARELAETAKRQLADHLRSDREVVAAVEEERDAADSVADALREQVGLWRDRFGSERELRVSTEEALREAREALESATRVRESPGWTGHVWTGVKIAGAFGAGYGFAKVW